MVFEGRGSIAVGDVEEVLEPLKGIRVLPGRPHRCATTRDLLRYFVCASPGTDPTIDRAPAEAPRAGSTPDARILLSTPSRPGTVTAGGPTA